MAVVVVDGIEIDTTTWIDEHVARFKDQGDSLGARSSKLATEIANYRRVLENYGKQIPRDAYGEAHVKGYLQELERAEKELANEWNQKVKKATDDKSNSR
jgi:hypothetical protein